MRSTALILIVLIAQAVVAQDWARTQLAKSPRHQEWVTVKRDGRSIETFVVYPESKDKKPVVILIHEIFGMSDWMQDLADQVAAAGYIAVAPDLLSGMGPHAGRTSDFAPDKVTEAVSHLNPDQVTGISTPSPITRTKFPHRTESCPQEASAGAADKPSASLPIVPILAGLLCSMAALRTRTPWPGSRPRSMGSTPAMTSALMPRCQIPQSR